MKIGFTGTRNGMTPEQITVVAQIFDNYLCIELHHGACVGADQDAVAILKGGGADEDGDWAYFIVAHPGISAGSRTEENPHLSQRAIELSCEVRETKTHFARNRDIVNETDLLIACPPCEPMPDSGGTAYTVNYAKKCGKPFVIVYPSGATQREMEGRDDD